MTNVIKYFLAVTLTSLMVVNVTVVYGQGTGFGIRVTPSLVPNVAVKNSSPSNVFGWSHFNVNVGVYALRYFKSSLWGVKAGLDFGAIPNLVGIDAPRNAFGKGGNTDEQINTWLRTSKDSYKALTVTASFKVPIKARYFEFNAGPSVRFYDYYRKDGYSEIGLAFNRAVPYDENDPSAGPPDVRVRITDLDLPYLSFPVSVDYVVRMGKRNQVKFGLMHNISAPLHGELEVQMYGKLYPGSFRPRTGFWGINMQYERLSKKASTHFEKRLRTQKDEKSFRKSFFAESYTKPGFLAATFDMRLKKGSNNGVGFTFGAGLGNGYLSEVPTNNTSPYKQMLAIPVGINYIAGQKMHGLEVGTGVTPQIPLENVRGGSHESGTVYTGRIGYRFQPVREGFVGRIAWAPLLEHIPIQSNHELTLRNFAISVGYSFK
jgi:hypothetical protein